MEDVLHADKVVLVCDNLNTHSPACLYEAFQPAEAHRIANKLEWHYTPEHGSWLNIAEVELSVLSRQCLNRRMPHQEFVATGQRLAIERNTKTKTIKWQFPTAKARIKLARLYPVIAYKTNLTSDLEANVVCEIYLGSVDPIVLWPADCRYPAFQ